MTVNRKKLEIKTNNYLKLKYLPSVIIIPSNLGGRKEVVGIAHHTEYRCFCLTEDFKSDILKIYNAFPQSQQNELPGVLVTNTYASHITLKTGVSI